MRATPARTRLSLALGLAAALSGSAGCKRKTGPSEHYDKGAAIHQQLYVRLLDDAYLDPRMDDAVKELKQVDARSVSYPLALELLGQIEKGRKEAKLARDKRARELAEMEQGTRAPALDPSKILAASAGPRPPPAAAEQPDAGVAEADPYGPGASIADINRATGGCLIADTTFREEGGNVSGTVYRLAPSDACKDKLPGFVGQAVLAINGRIYRRVPASEVKAPGQPDAGAAAQATPAPAAPAAKPAAGPVQVPGYGGLPGRTESPPAFEGQQAAPKPDEAKGVKLEEAKGVRGEESQPAKMDESTPKPGR